MYQQFVNLLIEIFRLGMWLIILFIIFVPLERLFAVRPQRFFRKGFVTDLSYYFLNSLAPAVLLGLPIAALAWAAHLVVPKALLGAMATLPFWARSVAAFVAGELGYYWGHRWSHEIPALWKDKRCQEPFLTFGPASGYSG